MAPTGSARKRLKPSPSGVESSDGVTLPQTSGERLTPQKQGSSNWYPTVWPASKAAPVTEVARESISVAQNVPLNLSSISLPDSPKQLRHPSLPRSLRLTKKEGASSRSLPADTTTTKVNIASDGSVSTAALDTQLDSNGPGTQSTDKEAPSDKGTTAVDDTTREQVNTETTLPNAAAQDVKPEHTLPPPDQVNGWFSWFYASSTAEKNISSDPAPAPAPAKNTTASSAEGQALNNCDATPDEQGPTEQNNNPADITETRTGFQQKSWYQMWYDSSSPSKGPEEPKSEPPKPSPATGEQSRDTTAHTVPPSPPSNQQPESSEIPESVSTTSVKNGKAPGWSLWFRDTSNDPAQGQPQEGQLAETPKKQEPSLVRPEGHSHPNPDSEQKVEITKKGSVKIKPPKGHAAVPDKVLSGSETLPNALPPSTFEATASKQLQRILPDQVLPRFSDTFVLQEPPSLLQSLGRFLHYNKASDNKQVYKIRDPPRIKKALAIGIHGYFPAPVIRNILGQPTGTSTRFSTMAADAIREWTEDHGYSCGIGKIALEGEGRIAERVDLLWKLLLDWVEEIKKADFILVACHSQGVPVAILLVAKLISFGCLNATRIGVCAMAGVNMGPFSDYKSRWISGSAGELFEFASPFSQVSKDYEAALSCALDFGVRISYVGSIDDQLVSLESSLFSPMNHPYIYRAVFVDGRVHAPSFVSHLVGFILKLRNLGVSDHGLIRELSSPLAGSLYTGEGHSRLYHDRAVYRLAIEFALETSNVSRAALEIKRPQPSPANPYILPFAMRGLLEEEYVRRELYEETIQLLKQFDEWKPTSKVLKDVKFRLEGIRSKL